MITSKQNNHVKYIRNLRDKRTREQEKCFVIEGTRLVAEAVASGFLTVKLIVSENGLKRSGVEELISRCGEQTEVVMVSDQVMEYASDTESPQGIMAVIKMPGTTIQDVRVDTTSMYVVIDSVQDPGNVGTIIRAADAFGAGAVFLTHGCADIYNAKTLRSTMGSVFHLPVVPEAGPGELTEFLRENHIFTAATALGDTAVPVNRSQLNRPLALIFGSEARGVSEELSQLADLTIKILMPGAAESLNVAIAAGIVLYEAARQHGSSPNSNL